MKEPLEATDRAVAVQGAPAAHPHAEGHRPAVAAPLAPLAATVVAGLHGE